MTGKITWVYIHCQAPSQSRKDLDTKTGVGLFTPLELLCHFSRELLREGDAMTARWLMQYCTLMLYGRTPGKKYVCPVHYFLYFESFRFLSR